ncbi:hypothetical protein PENSTE_c006G08279 [Penicillium steckii]|uniref:Aminoglycoside phosphotransferase domain-containing protein n=1 Tax=Penicillium steckii TaxID=303698 RepID=A0A1V6TFM3_9EURO|nr:hypothetical protein PENSTE_c006G08279 [Penicillium steckii]
MTDVSLSERNDDDALLFIDEQAFYSPGSSADEEYASHELPALKLDLQKLKDCASEVASARCVNVRKLSRGAFHEIFILDFEPNPNTMVEIAKARNSCIARFTRREEPMQKATSELATMKYVKEHSSIPVAKIFYQDLCPDNQVGAPFVLMERLPGKHLYRLWNTMPLEHKKDVLTQLARVLTTLATFRFNVIGSLQDYGIGPLVHCFLPDQDKSFPSTVEFLSAFFREDTVEDSELKDVYNQLKQELENYFSTKSDVSYLNAPFRLIHGDFDAQNLLFVESSPGSGKAPVLSGVLDFENSYTGPLYYLYDYPIFIQDVDHSPQFYEENAILRPHFVRALRNAFPRDSQDAIEARNVMREKNFFLNDLERIMFLVAISSDRPDFIISGIRYFLKDLNDGTGLAYTGRMDYVPDPELDSDKD